MFRLILVMALFSSMKGSAHVKKFELNKALKQNVVRVEANSLGTYSGYCVKLIITNLTKDSVQICVEPGTRLKALEEKYQDILVTKQEIITLNKQEQKTQSVKGYCCQASDCSPALDSKFSVGFHPDSNLVTLARYLNMHQEDSDAEQHAIWAISNNHATANIRGDSATTANPLLQLVSALKNEELPWYQICTRTKIYKSGNIEVIPLTLHGELDYTAQKEEYATLIIKNKSGQQVCFIKSQWLQVGAQKKYSLNIPLQGLPKGEYRIELKSNGNEIASRKFEI